MSLALNSLFKDAQSKNQIYLANKQKSLNYNQLQTTPSTSNVIAAKSQPRILQALQIH